MQKKIYLTGIEKGSGKSFVSLGFLTAIRDQISKVRCYKLFSESDHEYLPLLSDFSDRAVVPLMTINEGITMMRNHPEDLLSQIFEATQTNDKLCVFEGTDFEGYNDAFEFQFNLTLAAQLNCEVILIVSAKNRAIEHIHSLINTAIEIGKKQHAKIVGVIVNLVSAPDETAIHSLLSTYFNHLAYLAVILEFDSLANPTVKDIVNTLNAKIICGQNQLLRRVKQITIAAKSIDNFLKSGSDRSGMLIITPYDRIDILLGSLLADQSANYPKIAGIVLTGGEMLSPVIYEIIAGLEHPFPVMLITEANYETATRLFSAKFSLNKDNPSRVRDTIETISPYLYAPMASLLKQHHAVSHLSSPVFLYELTRKVKQMNPHIVLPEGEDPRILAAADHLLKRQIVKITLLGNPEKINILCKRLELSLPDVQIIDIEKSANREQYAQQYFQLRQHKNINFPIALERMSDVNYFAAMKLYNNHVDGMVSGAIHTTADTVRPALEIIKTKPGINKVSSVFIMGLPTRVLVYGDCAINPEPDSLLLSEITLQAAEIAKKLGIEPKVALLSYSSGESGKGESVDKVAKAMELVRAKQPNLLAEGPIQYDAAVDPDVAKIKLPQSKLAGDATVLIFPDLNTGNNTYKAVQRETGALAIGPILLGLNKPVNDLSRGCTPQDIINTILITAVQAEGEQI